MATSFGWAVVYPVDRGFGFPGCPVLGTVEGTRAGAIQAFVDRWRGLDEIDDPSSIVWRRAYRKGWRVARVAIVPQRSYAGSAAILRATQSRSTPEDGEG